MRRQKVSREAFSKKPGKQIASIDPLHPRWKSYDERTGVVYNEIEISGPKSSNLGWISDFSTPSLVRTRKRPNGGKGARTLHEMILQKLGIESQDLTVEALQDLPWNIGQHIWESICANHTESLYIWRTFAIAFGRDFANPARRHFLDIKSPTLAITEYQRGVTSMENSWLTCLRISPKQLAVSDLVSVSNISNLTVLDLSDGQHSIENRDTTFDIRVMRSWAELARSGRAFQNLRVLMLGWQEKVDTWIFDFLDDFPKIRLLVISRCRNLDHKNHRDWEDDAWRHNWTFMPSKRGVKHLRSLLDDKSLYKGKVSGMHHESGRDSADQDLDADSQHSRAPNIPLLEVWLGTPRVWTHIMDEFAGTGTIFFRKKLSERAAPTKKEVMTREVVGRSVSSQTMLSQKLHNRQSSAPRRRSTKQSTATLLAEMSSKV